MLYDEDNAQYTSPCAGQPGDGHTALAGAGTLHGVLITARPAGQQLTEGNPVQLSTFARHAALALERVRAQEERELIAVLGDRERVARDLHDVVIQRPAAASRTRANAHTTWVAPWRSSPPRKALALG
jgi:nitrate/nitrite-specific signal transduction histidine kinase